MNIPIILGTAREGRQSEKAAKYMLQQAKEANIESEIIDTEFLDVRDYRIAATGEQTPAAKAFSEKMTRADGLIIVSPEYNHGYPGELKMMIDMLYKEYNRKPVGICGVSAGALGGARVVEKLRLVVVELQMVPIREAVYFPKIQELFDESGNIKDESYAQKVQTFLEELLWYARALKEARDKDNK